LSTARRSAALACFYLERPPGETGMRWGRVRAGTAVLAGLSDDRF
jgi:hypothetical protein